LGAYVVRYETPARPATPPSSFFIFFIFFIVIVAIVADRIVVPWLSSWLSYLQTTLAVDDLWYLTTVPDYGTWLARRGLLLSRPVSRLFRNQSETFSRTFQVFFINDGKRRVRRTHSGPFLRHRPGEHRGLIGSTGQHLHGWGCMGGAAWVGMHGLGRYGWGRMRGCTSDRIDCLGRRRPAGAGRFPQLDYCQLPAISARS
jgi:hypothetical protein